MKTKPNLPPSISRIVLVGFMGAGKSTVGALLAAELRWRFLDADRVIEERAGRSIAEIFAHCGEAEFRALESAAIRDILREQQLVLALGGGAVETPAVRETLLASPENCAVFLHAPLEVMIARCEQQPEAALRPVLQDRERLRSRFESRLPHYENAHFIIDTANATPEETARRIVEAVSPFLKENTPA